MRQRKLEGLSNVQEEKNDLMEQIEKENEKEKTQDYVFLAFARVFSGTLRKDQEVFILSPKHNPDDFVGKVKKN